MKILKGVRIWDYPDTRSTDITIDNGKIITIEDSMLKKIEVGYNNFESSEIKTIDAEGLYVLPGLVNAHTHSPMWPLSGLIDVANFARATSDGNQNLHADATTFRSWLKIVQKAEMSITPDDVKLFSILTYSQMLLKGITTVADFYIHLNSLAIAAIDSGIRAHLVRGMIDRLDAGIVNRNDDERYNRVKDRLNDCGNLHRKWQGTGEGRITIGIGPHSPHTCSDELLIGAAEMARDLSCPLHIHLAEDVEATRRYRAENQGVVRHLESLGLMDTKILGIHCCHLNEKDMDILAGYANFWVVYCPYSNRQLGVGEAPVKQMSQLGINIALGTDGAASNPVMDLRMDGQMAAETLEMSDRKRVRSMSLAGSDALGLEGGKIEASKLADLVLVKDLSAFLGGKEEPVHVFVNGEHVVKDGRCTLVDMDELSDRAKERKAELMEGWGLNRQGNKKGQKNYTGV